MHFGYVSTAPAKPWYAWVAGPCYWCMAHTTGRSKPCLDWISGGALTCPRCASPKPAEEIGYQPLYRDIDGRPVMVIVHSYSREQIDTLKFRQFVTVGRGVDASDPVMVSAVAGKQTWYHSTLAERQVPADLTETLLRVWQIPELVAWYRGQSDNSVSLDRAAPVTSTGEPFGPMTAAAAQRYGADDGEGGPSAATFDAVKDRLKDRAAKLKPSPNGKH